MKKLRLLLAFCALLLGWSNASAQASYNHTYTEGVTVAAGTDYFLYNIGSQMFLTDGMDWGAHATADHAGRKITFTEVSSGKYSIYTASYSVNNSMEAKAGFMTTNGYLDTGTNDANWVFTPVSVGGYTNVYPDGYKRPGKGKTIQFPNKSEIIVPVPVPPPAPAPVLTPAPRVISPAPTPQPKFIPGPTMIPDLNPVFENSGENSNIISFNSGLEIGLFIVAVGALVMIPFTEGGSLALLAF